jgi:hypothetical protein
MPLSLNDPDGYKVACVLCVCVFVWEGWVGKGESHVGCVCIRMRARSRTCMQSSLAHTGKPTAAEKRGDRTSGVTKWCAGVAIYRAVQVCELWVGEARDQEATQGKARRDEARGGEGRSGEGQGKAKQGQARQDKAG